MATRSAKRAKQRAPKRAAPPPPKAEAPAPSDDVFISRTEAARLIGLQPDTLSSRRSTGRPVPPSYRIGNRCRYKKAEVLAFRERFRDEGR